MKKKHFWFMQEAFIEAKKAFEKGEVPVGAVAVIDDKIVARAHNNTENSQLFFSHAEFLVLIEVNRQLRSYRMNMVNIYVTLEPCMMCFGALIQSRVNKIYYSASNINFNFYNNFLYTYNNLKYHEKFVKLFIFESESQNILRKFFANLRYKQSYN
ncbi:MAG: nucleoside deaminase [Sweet potato little leaf phytoplasma]|uniref:Nucleoside deaminase n=4 Tax=Candidatus Phytoplasma TaxID=33926 RepID=A0A9K3Y6D8_9MOLU|nr:MULTISPECIES: nucleoside deaminase [Phytoplasma]QLL36642.1 tRNA(adenine34) deaminase ['Echinacea purpurea' witches'-broom phytoplasma]WEX20125.1 MAG: tRNA(adenine34) deaminase [Candidatus Phytoplasma aurantifolia]EMR14586.1 cytosine/adenosine deaminase [Peanut witches'-broom phytoplasma NTU2011]MCG3566718.1 nucleoside deaminase [Sesame phyllody phytoplasma]MDO7987039.1 nucleoside deaminase [Sweet potato little leaf phytoplasma]